MIARREKSVRFLQEVNNDLAALTMTLQLGGAQNRTTVVEVNVDVKATKTDVQKLSELIQTIEGIFINPLSIKTDNIK